MSSSMGSSQLSDLSEDESSNDLDEPTEPNEPGEYPRALINQVNTAYHRQSERDVSRENPVPWIFLVTYSKDTGGGPSFTIEGAYTSLEKANAAAMDFFRRRHRDLFEVADDMSNWFDENEYGGDDDEEMTVGWEVTAHGELLLRAVGRDEYDEKFDMKVVAKRVN
ncbi:hypothetical protein N7499_010723 [Penicillium canescens]|uniref:Uncharacterized protein n=1 Tax=Penicillium canescens TaxID=5083 RepID=A0AAD6NC33_PENCN|nr:uncharacterized protein N7446_005991 [Penicillium canescens]KAJ6051359.1 hypothetical protein N7460_001893 [Penicillium canescens]KAJ6061871.1 hypothetical protein N7446_005991 [Penicillium canescens]KAJ6065121.1 hypothetical protein N7444_000774 [Penicillium canescens]KAJ6068836.1 hypothetical protein N7499_010723 [Penicillium canescens]KAJ6183108.1 hypothetical protein N7485_001750 [Penicillium canescens]